jgi:hypothetical protein
MLEGNLANGLQAALSVIGADSVKSLATKSGRASGCGHQRVAIAYGAATVGVIALEALGVGRMGQMLGGTRATGLEFSHSLARSRGGPRAWWNGSMVTPWIHAMSDIDRFLPGMGMADKTWSLGRQLLNLIPAWMQGLLGIETGLLSGSIIDKDCP